MYLSPSSGDVSGEPLRGIYREGSHYSLDNLRDVDYSYINTWDEAKSKGDNREISSDILMTHAHSVTTIQMMVDIFVTNLANKPSPRAPM
jgi:hypothetical protein